ncbi:MAG: 3-deoxy-D-manno-octulosonic acid transferase [Halothiobacillaceae bacterium]
MKGLAGYRWLLVALLPLVFGHAVIRAWRDGGGRYLRQRFGRGYRDGMSTGRRPDWIHCASVGEVFAAAPLIERLAGAGRPLLVTTTTPTGAAQLARRFPSLVHAYLPLDYPAVVRRFLAHWRPARLLVVETEIWPNLYAACAGAGLPIVILNARLSRRTMNAPGWLRALYARSLAQVAGVLTRSAHDAERFVQLGAPAGRVEVLGNLKFCAVPSLPVDFSPPARPYLLAASTREGEEALVLDAWRRAAPDGALLVIAPRHPERRGEILRALSGLNVALRSRGDPVGPDTEVYLADTLGELPGFMAFARLVFMGGSLVPKGGHNPLEPAALGAPVLTGPNLDNFLDEYALLDEVGALRRVGDSAQLAEAIAALWDDAPARDRMATAGRSVIVRQAGILDAYLDRLANPQFGGAGEQMARSDP